MERATDSITQEGTGPVIPDRFNLAGSVLAAGPDSAPALSLVGDTNAQTWSYGDLRAAVGGAAALLADHVAPGGRVLLRIGNSVEFPVAYLAALTADLVPVVTSSQLTEPEVVEIARQVAPTLAVQDPALPAARDVPVLTLDVVRAAYGTASFAPVLGDPHRPGYIVFTSGTSGQARAVVHAHRAILARQMMIRDWYALTPQDRMLHAGAFNWTYTLGTGLMDPWSVGAVALIPQVGTDPAALSRLIAQHNATIFAAAPGVYRRMLREALPALPDLRHGLAAGEKLPQTLRARWQAATGTDIYEAFGMSECSTFISSAPHRPATDGTLGQAQRGRHVALIGSDGPVPRGTEGEIAVHRSDPGLMLGYHNAPDETAARFQGDWFLTGDRAVMDAGGQITYLGRADDMMNAGGFRVSPLEVEQAMAQHPAITECAAIELRVGPETSVIALAYTGTVQPTPELEAFAARHLARYKQPRLWHHLPTLPRGANNKLLRRALRTQLESQT